MSVPLPSAACAYCRQIPSSMHTEMEYFRGGYRHIAIEACIGALADAIERMQVT